MPALAIGIIAVVALAVFLLPLAANASPVEANDGIPPEQEPPESKPKGSPPSLAPVAAAWVAGNFALGESLTGDKLGGVAGLIGGGGLISAGNAGNVGRVAGGEIDQLLGGTRGGTTGIIAEASGWVTGFVWGLFGALQTVGIFSVALPVYAISAVITDLNRLAYGQKGARADYDKLWGEAEARFREELVKRYEVSPVGKKSWGKSAGQVPPERYSWPMADGYMRQKNKLDYTKTMKDVAWGVGVSESAHGKFWADRGAFVGQYNGMNEPANSPEMKWWGNADYATIRLAEPGLTKTITYQRVYGYSYEFQRKTIQDDAPHITDYSTGKKILIEPPAWVTESMLKSDVQTGILIAPSVFRNPSNAMEMVNTSHFWKLVWIPHYRQETGIADNLADEMSLAGKLIANVEAWIAWNMKPHGAFVSDFGHAKHGLESGQFDADSVEDGGKVGPILNYGGKRFDRAGKAIE